MDDFDLYGDDGFDESLNPAAAEEDGLVKTEQVKTEANVPKQANPQDLYNTYAPDEGIVEDDPYAPKGLYVHELTWYTTDEDLHMIAEEAGVADQAIPSETTFYEHKVNGKSRGTAFMQFKTSRAARAVKELMDRIEIHGKKPRVEYAEPDLKHNPYRIIPKDPKEIRAEQAAASMMGKHVQQTGPVRTTFTMGGNSRNQPYGRKPQQGPSGGMMPMPPYGMMPPNYYPPPSQGGYYQGGRK